MAELHLQVPDEHVAAVYRFVADLMTPADPEPLPRPALGEWTNELALEAITSISSASEYSLVRRMSEAHGERVPASELASSLGLPGVPDAAQDFASLSAWCSAQPGRPPMPIRSGGDGTDGWYWMPIEAYLRFLWAFDNRQVDG